MSAAEARQVLRSLLRAIDRTITPVTGNRQWREHALAEFKRAKALPAAETQQALQEAKDYAFLITSIKDHKDLLLSYNIGIAIEQREADMNVRAATLVGLRMPPKAGVYD